MVIRRPSLPVNVPPVQPENAMTPSVLEKVGSVEKDESIEFSVEIVSTASAVGLKLSSASTAFIGTPPLSANTFTSKISPIL
jgi:hypothetical protein